MHTLLTLYLGIAVSEWERRLVVECNEVDGFHLPAVTYAADNAKESISHNDLLLLSKEKVKEIWSFLLSTSISPCILTYSSWAFSFCLVDLHCAYLIVLVPVCYGLFYSFLKMGLFEKVYLLFHFFSFFWGGGGEGTFGKQCILIYIMPCFVS